jgi:nucleoside-diphosphate kinase
MKSRKVFLKRTKAGDLRLRDLFAGAVVNVFSRQVACPSTINFPLTPRQMNIVGYADDFTRKKLGARQEKTLAMIKPDAVGRMGDIIDLIELTDFTICNMKLVTLTRANAEGLSLSRVQVISSLGTEFYAEHRGKPFFETLVAFMTSGPIVALELLAVDAIQQACAELPAPLQPHSITVACALGTHQLH